MSKHDLAVPPALPPQPSVREGIWLVGSRSGVVSMTLDELDEAFQRGEVRAETPVFTSGMATWQTLGVLAHLDEVPERGDGQPTPTLHQPITGVQRSPGRLPFALRRALVRVMEGAAALRAPRRRRAVIGVWAAGAVLWLLYFILPPQLAVSEASVSAAAPSLQPRAARPSPDESIPVLHPAQLQPVAPTQPQPIAAAQLQPVAPAPEHASPRSEARSSPPRLGRSTRDGKAARRALVRARKAAARRSSTRSRSRRSP